MTIEFKKSEVKDAEQIIHVRADAFQDEIKLYGHGPDGTESIEKEQKFIENTEGNHFSYILLNDGKIIGGFGGLNQGNGNFYLGCIYVAMEYQGKGIGSAIMKFILDEFPGAIRWTVKTPYLSYRNHHFYEKHGFVKVGETEPRQDGFILFLYERVMQ